MAIPGSQEHRTLNQRYPRGVDVAPRPLRGALYARVSAHHIHEDRPAAVLGRARSLAAGRSEPLAVTRACFEWVRDEIQQCVDYGRDELTCAASEVLRAGTGFCYAKSHLLVALLRTNGLPAGLCSQRLARDAELWDRGGA